MGALSPPASPPSARTKRINAAPKAPEVPGRAHAEDRPWARSRLSVSPGQLDRLLPAAVHHLGKHGSGEGGDHAVSNLDSCAARSNGAGDSVEYRDEPAQAAEASLPYWPCVRSCALLPVGSVSASRADAEIVHVRRPPRTCRHVRSSIGAFSEGARHVEGRFRTHAGALCSSRPPLASLWHRLPKALRGRCLF